MNGQSIMTIIAGILMQCILLAPQTFSADINLSWTANTEADLAGYKLYWGSQSKQYISSQDVGNATTVILSGFPDQGTVYFAVTAYDGSGNESNKSLEAAITFPKRGCDVNSNGVTDVMDLQQIVNAILRGMYLSNGDIDQNKKLNVLDLVKEANVIVGKIQCPLP